MEKNEVFEELKEFVIQQACISDVILERQTRLEEDIGITGDDAVEFIIAFGLHFNVDVSQFMITDYFEGEGDLLLSEIFEWLLRREKVNSKKTLTLGDLEKAIFEKELI